MTTVYSSSFNLINCMSFLESIVHFDILKFVSSYMIISDAMTVIGFLKHYGLDKDYKVLTCVP